jgi:hypothetical protein
VLAENDDRFFLPLSYRGGEANSAAANEHRDACRKQSLTAPSL